MFDIAACREYFGNVGFVEKVRDCVHWFNEIELEDLTTHLEISLDSETVVVDRTP